MSDDSDEGYFPGESRFEDNQNIINDNNEENIDNQEQEEYYQNNNENYNNNYNEYNDEQEDDNPQQYNDNNDNYNYNDDYNDYDYDYNYQYDDNNNYYGDNNYYGYNNDYENNYDNYNYKYNYNNNDKYKKKYRPNNRNNNNFRPLVYKTVKSEDYYYTSFAQKFKLWLIIVIQILSKKEKEKITFYGKDEKINNEIIDSFLQEYKNQKKNIKGNKIEGEKETDINKLDINIEKIKVKEIVSEEYNIEFNIIITDELEIYFVKKYIKIKVKGEITKNKYPKFYFKFKKYKITLNDEGINYKKNNEQDSKSILEQKENKDKDVDKSKEKDDEKDKKKDKRSSNIIVKNKNEEESSMSKQFCIGMCPDYSIKNHEFYNLLMELKNNTDEKNNNIKTGPQEEIKYIFFELTHLLKEKNNKK